MNSDSAMKNRVFSIINMINNRDALALDNDSLVAIAITAADWLPASIMHKVADTMHELADSREKK